MNDELNKKLALWAGFIEGDIKKHYYYEIGGERVAKWQEPGKEWHIKVPNFTESLDACFKWLVPKLNKEYGWWITVARYAPHTGIMKYFANLSPKHGMGICIDADAPALALCLAIEKLIDSRED